MKPRLLLDLFCGAGGAAAGYRKAGFQVVGVDNAPQPNYPFPWLEADAMEVLSGLNKGHSIYIDDFYSRSDFCAIHASPPCQAYTRAKVLHPKTRVGLIAQVREALCKAHKPYIIENVPGAPLYTNETTILEGQMFKGQQLKTVRERWFETNFPVRQPYRPPRPKQAKMGRPPRAAEWIQVVGHFSNVRAARSAMGIGWMTRDELAEAIPPAYTNYIGKALWHHLSQGL